MKLEMKRTEVLFCLAWGVFSFSILMELTAGVSKSGLLLVIMKLIRYSAYALCCLKIVLDYMKKKDLYVFVVMLTILLLSSLRSTNKTMLLYSLILLAAYHMDAKRMLKISLWIQGAFLTLVVVLSQMGILEDYLFERDATHFRHGLGFAWTTTAPILFLYYLLIFIFLKKDKFSVFQALFFEIINIWLYLKTDSRMAFWISSVFLVFFAFQSQNKKRWKWLSRFNGLYVFMPIVICFFSLNMFIFYDENNVFWSHLNSILSDRLRLGIDAIHNFGFSILGQNIEWVGFSIKTPTKAEAIGYNYVDSSYLQLALNYGILFLIIVILIYIIILHKAVESKDYYLVSILMIIMVFSVTEPRLMNLAFNPFPLLAFCQLQGGEGEKCVKS